MTKVLFLLSAVVMAVAGVFSYQNREAFVKLRKERIETVDKLTKDPQLGGKFAGLCKEEIARLERTPAARVLHLLEQDGIGAIGSGGSYAQSAAKALQENTELSPAEIVKKALTIAGELCIYTNLSLTIETLD